ncbi:MAG TPA: oligosaccharide flippase family protein [Polyangia bacterium]|nr:oligosaccharide flippase family protein [Polyangia bacterium]
MDPSTPTEAAAAPGSRAVGAGRGLLYITAAKVWFMVGGAAIGFVLPYLLRSKAAFGDWGTILSFVSPLNNVMVTATIQTVSKFASRGPEYVEGAKRAALKLQLGVGVVLALAFFLGAPLIASAQHGAGLTAGLRLSSAVVLLYSFYAVFVGAANGAREFQKQAGLDATFTTLRAGMVCGGAIVFSSVLGAVSGFVAAALAVLVISVALVGLGKVKAQTSVRELLNFMVPVAGYLLILNLLMFVDGWILRPLVEEAARTGGASLAGRDPATLASEQIGLYTAAQNVARIPYQAILSVTFVIFPLVSQATFTNDVERTRSYIQKSIRLPLLVVLAMAVAVAARPSAVLAFFPRGEYLSAGSALAILCFGYVAFSVMSIAGTILNGAGRIFSTIVLGAVTLALDIVLTWMVVRWVLHLELRDPLLKYTLVLKYTAAATTMAMTIGAGLSLGYLQHVFGAALKWQTGFKSGVAAILAIVVAQHLPIDNSRLGNLVVCGLASAIYIVVLFMSDELSPQELRELVRRKR